MNNVESLEARRPLAAQDCRRLAVADALREALRRIESGEYAPSMVYVAFASDLNSGGDRKFSRVCAGGDRLALGGLLAKHMHWLNADDGDA